MRKVLKIFKMDLLHEKTILALGYYSDDKILSLLLFSGVNRFFCMQMQLSSCMFCIESILILLIVFCSLFFSPENFESTDNNFKNT